MKLVVGLGNPGEKYENTRHNIGFEVANRLAEAAWKINKKFNAEISEGKIGREKIIFLKPQTFMNNSGRAVAAAAGFYKIKPADILVIHDDIDLPLGKIRIKKDGSSGGHRGIESIIAALGSENFLRLKIGLRPGLRPRGAQAPEGGPHGPEGVAPEARPKNFDAAKFVLKKFSKKEKKTVEETIKKATEAAALILSGDTPRAMNLFN
jgi:PTH1 family peptidyl-tRNA hydrolase